MPEIVAENISIIESDELEGATRMDAEYYQPEYLTVDNKIRKHRFVLLEDVAKKVSDGTHFTPHYTETGFPFLSALNVIENWLDLSAGHNYISESEHSKIYKRCDPKQGDILIRKVGVGPRWACVIPNGVPEFSIFVSVALVRVFYSKINPLYLSAFINSYYGQAQLFRFNKGISQPDLHLEEIKRLKIPLAGDGFQSEIEQIVTDAWKNFNHAEILYSQAEALLLEELGLKNVDLSHEPCYEVNSADTLSASRIDAEYYQPKYEKLLSILQKKAHYCKHVKDFRNFNDRGLQPVYAEDGKLKVINSKHILEQHLDYDNFERTDDRNWNLQNSARVFKYDILIYTTGANVGRTNVYFDDDKALASNHVNILRLREENPLYVCVVLNSLIGRLQTRHLVTGSAQVELYSSDIDKFLIPFIDVKKQEKIASLVEESYTAKRKAKSLLDDAKRKVEELIERESEK